MEDRLLASSCSTARDSGRSVLRRTDGFHGESGVWEMMVHVNHYLSDGFTILALLRLMAYIVLLETH